MADTLKFVQAQTFTLAGAGAALGATSITLNSLKQIDGTTNITMTDIGTKGFMTLEPDNGTQEEAITFSGITQNANGTATLTGVKTVLFVDPYTETSGLAKTHAGGVQAIITNSAAFYAALSGKNNDETISGLWTFTTLPQSAVTPTSALDLATKAYVDNRHGYWEAPVATVGALPAGVTTGEVRVALDTLAVYIWNGAAWTQFTASSATTTATYLLGSEATGGDHRTFTSTAAFSLPANLSVFRNGVRMAYGASIDYTTTGTTKAVFNYDVLDSDIISLIVIE